MNMRDIINLCEVSIPTVGNEAFKAWFGNSKVVDAQGNPLVVYHGTGAKFRTFDRKRSIGGLFWFTDDRQSIESREIGAQGHGIILETYLSIQNPAGWDEYDKLMIVQIQSKGYDGIILPNRDGTNVYVAFEPYQIKSIKNRGTWDASKGNMHQ